MASNDILIAMTTIDTLSTGDPVYAVDSAGKCGRAKAYCPDNPMKHEVMGVAQRDADPSEQVTVVASGFIPSLLNYVDTGDRTHESLVGQQLYLRKHGGITIQSPDKPCANVSIGMVVSRRGDIFIDVNNNSAERTEVMDGQCRLCRSSVHESAYYCYGCIQMMDHAKDVARSQPLSESFRKWTIRMYNKMTFRMEKICTECNARDGTVRPDADELDYYCSSCVEELSGND